MICTRQVMNRDPIHNLMLFRPGITIMGNDLQHRHFVPELAHSFGIGQDTVGLCSMIREMISGYNDYFKFFFQNGISDRFILNPPPLVTQLCIAHDQLQHTPGGVGNLVVGGNLKVPGFHCSIVPASRFQVGPLTAARRLPTGKFLNDQFN